MQANIGWARQKPTAPGVYQVRGFNLCRPRRQQVVATVVVELRGGRDPVLVCNLHASNSENDRTMWSRLENMCDSFEWRGPLVLQEPKRATKPSTPRVKPWAPIVAGVKFTVPAGYDFVAQDGDGCVYAYKKRPQLIAKWWHDGRQLPLSSTYVLLGSADDVTSYGESLQERPGN